MSSCQTDRRRVATDAHRGRLVRVHVKIFPLSPTAFETCTRCVRAPCKRASSSCSNARSPLPSRVGYKGREFLCVIDLKRRTFHMIQESAVQLLPLYTKLLISASRTSSPTRQRSQKATSRRAPLDMYCNIVTMKPQLQRARAARDRTTVRLLHAHVPRDGDARRTGVALASFPRQRTLSSCKTLRASASNSSDANRGMV